MNSNANNKFSHFKWHSNRPRHLLIFLIILLASSHFHSAWLPSVSVKWMSIGKVWYSELSKAGCFRGMADGKVRLYSSNHWHTNENDLEPRWQLYFQCLFKTASIQGKVNWNSIRKENKGHSQPERSLSWVFLWCF